MELRYPFIIIIIPITIFLIIKGSRKKNNYIDGSKIANTEYIKNTQYYKNKVKKFKILKAIIFIMFFGILISSTLLLSRLTEVKTINRDEYNRDIFLCMDVSASVDELNIELVENLKETVKNLKGERFGISIFNTSSVVLVPLTDDYDYIINILDEIYESIKTNNDYNYAKERDDFFYIRNYIYSGTLEGNKTRGSSLIGDGLASCVYSFSNIEEKRTRIIVFSTDNDLAGTPLLTLSEAANISKNKNIKVFGIGTKIMKDKNRTEFKSAVEKTGGKFYEHSSSTVKNIVSDIESTSKSLLKNKKETKKIDIPEIPFVILLISLIGFMISSKKVLS